MSGFDIANIYKFGNLILAAWFSWRAFRELDIKSKTFHYEEFRFFKEFIEETRRDGSHPLVMEKGGQAISGKILQVDEIKYLLSFSSPSQVLKDYAKAKSYLEYNSVLQKIGYKPKYQDQRKRLWAKRKSLLWYIFYILLMLPLILFPHITFSSIITAALSLGIYVPCLVFLALGALNEYAKVEAAERVLQAEAHYNPYATSQKNSKFIKEQKADSSTRSRKKLP